jgi:type I restriction-modification system DNA methylase subunit
MTIANIEQILSKKELSPDDLKVLEHFEPNEGTNKLYSFFTPVWLCKVMYDLAIRNGFDPKKGKILEPAAGTGNFLTVFDHPENCTAFELDKLNYQIAQKRVPGIKYFHNDYFETSLLQPPRFTTMHSTRGSINKVTPTWLNDYPFDLVIGNPPYGKYKNLYSSYFKNLKIKQVELFFMYQSMRFLKPGGLLVFITSSSFLRNDKTYLHEKKLIGKYSDFVDAYRMPKVFSNTSVPTDILIFRRK